MQVLQCFYVLTNTTQCPSKGNAVRRLFVVTDHGPWTTIFLLPIIIKQLLSSTTQTQTHTKTRKKERQNKRNSQMFRLNQQYHYYYAVVSFLFASLICWISKTSAIPMQVTVQQRTSECLYDTLEKGYVLKKMFTLFFLIFFKFKMNTFSSLSLFAGVCFLLVKRLR